MGGGYGGPPPAGGGGSKPNVGLLAILGILIVAAIGGGIFLLTSGDDDDDDSTELSDRDPTEDTELDLPDLDDDTTDTTEGDSTDTTEGSGGGGLESADIDVSEIEGMSDASDVILSFIQHEVDKNCDSMWTLVSSSWPDEAEFVADCEETYGGFGEIEVETVTVTSVSDSQIEVASDQLIDGSPHASTYTMVLEDGTWWIDSWE